MQHVTMALEVPRSWPQGRLLSRVCLVLQVFLKGKVGRRGIGPASVGFIVDKQVGPPALWHLLHALVYAPSPMHCFTNWFFMSPSTVLTPCGLVLQLNL